MLALDPVDPQTLYASAGGVYRTTDGAANWKRVLAVAADALTIDPSRAVFAAAEFVGIFRSTDGGSTWSLANEGLTNKALNALAADPSSPGTIYAGLDYDYDEGGTHDSIFKTIDGGEHWTGFGEIGGYVWALAAAPSPPHPVYADTRGSIGGAYDGVYRTDDGTG